MTVKTLGQEDCVEAEAVESVTEEPQLSIADGPSIDVLKQEEQNGSFDESVDFADSEIKGILEAVLFVSHDPVTVDKLSTVLEGVPKSKIIEVLRILQSDYESEGRGLCLSEVAGGFLLATRPDCGMFIRRLSKTKSSSKLSPSALEALAIVSYKQPITRSDIEKIRGVETSGVLRTLLDQKLVRIVGRQDVPGRPILYGTSKQFLQRFGLRDLRDLPPLKEIQDLGNPVTLALPFDEGEAPSDTASTEGNGDLPA
ncbi:SMC-Scp complex subunit ScpB [Nitrospira sp. M1]